MKQHDKWNEVKKFVDERENIINFKEREIFWTRIGENVGFEQNGKGNEFSRPVLVVKKLNKQLFFGVPLSTSIKSGNYFYQFSFLPNKISTALLVQAKVYDMKRVDTKMGMINKDDFIELKDGLKDLMGL
ncbi:MAG: type II toxin-antitoxin system PemK/MazF family toxin [Campylobacterota bacterium]|nr:type II toxin-antitoxin system PemK/MazF family toxin [Campylobacterota bacterium]